MCEICKKKPQFGHNVSHSNRKTRKIWKLNLFRVKGIYKGIAKRFKACTRCMRSGKIEKPMLKISK